MPDFEIRLLRKETDKYFLHGRRSLEDDIRFFLQDVVLHRTYLVATCGEEVLGMLAFVESSHWMDNAFGVGFISTHRAHQNQGVARCLVDALFELAAAEGKGVVMTPVEPAVRHFFEPALAAQAARHPQVPFLQRQ